MAQPPVPRAFVPVATGRAEGWRLQGLESKSRLVQCLKYLGDGMKHKIGGHVPYTTLIPINYKECEPEKNPFRDNSVPKVEVALREVALEQEQTKC